jgi:hypothetical protein
MNFMGFALTSFREYGSFVSTGNETLGRFGSNFSLVGSFFGMVLTLKLMSSSKFLTYLSLF